MMKHKHALLLILFIACNLCFAQQDDRITTMDFVQILNGNKAEAVYYYQNNWKILREMAVEKAYIHSYQVMETPFSEDAPFHMILVTTYGNRKQYDLREGHFEELINEKGALELMNEKKPGEFRKTLFHKEMVRHWD
ncbi:MAG: hypothetical protein AAGA66_05765 [Bacteroidota bacterium]